MNSKSFVFILMLIGFSVQTYAADQPVTAPPPPPAEKSLDAVPVEPEPAPEVKNVPPAEKVNDLMAADDQVISVPQNPAPQNQNGKEKSPEVKPAGGGVTETVEKTPNGKTITYSENGRPIYEENYDPDGKTISRTYYTYNDQGKLLHKWTVSAEDGHIMSETINTFDSEGRTLTHSSRDNDTGWYLYEEYQYDSEGRITFHLEDGPAGKKTVTTKYNDDGSFTITTVEINGDTTVEKFDKDGNLINPPPAHTPAENPGGLPDPAPLPSMPEKIPAENPGGLPDK